jgi:hypothetical protein
MRVLLFLICFIFKFAAIVFFTALLIIITEWLLSADIDPESSDTYIKNHENI